MSGTASEILVEEMHSTTEILLDTYYSISVQIVRFEQARPELQWIVWSTGLD